MPTRIMISVLLLSLFIAPAFGSAATARLHMVAGYPPVQDHWMGPDGDIGTVDDVINGSPSPMNGSAPNPGRLSYNAFDFTGIGTTDVGFPDGYNAVTFLTGSAEIDLDVAGGGVSTVPLFTNLSVTSGTEPFPGHGPFTADFTNIDSGSYDPATRAFTLTADFAANLGGFPDTADDITMAGTAWVVESADFGTPTGNAYIDDVLVPIAQARNADRLLYASGTGIIPPANGGSWGTMPFKAVIVAIGGQNVSVETLSWGAVKGAYRSP